jgi:hypothetical protein
MFGSYFQNTDVNMTKQMYFEMCEAVGSTPVDSEIPVEMDDFPGEIQEVFSIYFLLADIWDGMNGTYQGKNTVIVFELLKLYKIDPEDWLVYLTFIRAMDNIRKRLINEKAKQPKEPPVK